MKYEIDIYLPFNKDIKHISHVLMGLMLLASHNIVRLRWKNANIRHSSPLTLEIIATALGSGESKSIVYEMHDQSNILDSQLLEKCDVYFKRSYHHADVLSYPKVLQHKIRSYGIHLPSTTPALTRKLSSIFFHQAGLNMLRSPAFVVQQIRRYYNSYHQFIGLPSPVDYTQSPQMKVADTVFFQTRVWPQEFVGDDIAQKINDKRIDLVRALRKNFKNNFVGGILPTVFARKHYPDCITTHATDNKDYIRLLKSNLIGIYTRGLNHSIAIKLPEYLAASLCIVSENIRNYLPAALIQEENYLEFEDIDSCLANCERLLMDKELAHAMRQQNHRYYLDNIEPEKKVLDCVDACFNT